MAPTQGDSAPDLGLRLHGHDVTREAVEEAGNAMLELIKAVMKEQGYEGEVPFVVGNVQTACDGCDFRQDFDADRVGWSSAIEDDITNDYCPACTAERRAR